MIITKARILCSKTMINFQIVKREIHPQLIHVLEPDTFPL